MDNTPSPNAGNFPVPFSSEQLRKDMLVIFWHHLRTTTLFADEASIWPLTGQTASQVRLAALGGFRNLDLGPDDVEINFEQIANTSFARCLEMQFDFAYRGILTNRAAAMEMDSDHTWVALCLNDLLVSEVVDEVEAWTDSGLKAAVKRCHEASELANARLALEDRDIFCYFSTSRPGDRDESAPIEGLTIRQIAMLSGMEEMSVRTAVSRKGPNQLPTHKEDGRTLVRSEDARAWLKAKGRYLHITREWSGEQLQLEKTKFANLSELDGALQQQIQHLSGEAGKSPDDIKDRMRSVYQSHGYPDGLGVMTYAQAKDGKLMAAVAEALSLPPQLLVLRTQQAQLSDELQLLDMEISRFEAIKTPPALPVAAAATD